MDNSSIRLKLLAKEEYKANSNYGTALKNVNLSAGLCEIDFDRFYDNHLINSVVVLLKDNTIVFFMAVAPHAEFDKDENCWINIDSSFWYVQYIGTHKNYQRKGYAKMIMLYGIRDMILKGANRFDGCFNLKSRPLIEKIAKEFEIPIKYNMRNITISDIDKIQSTGNKILSKSRT